MSNRAIISTGDAPQAIGPYSQAVKVNGTVYLSGQIPLDPATMQMVEGDIRAQAERVFGNLNLVKRATKPNPQAGQAGGLIEREASIHISNVMLLNPATGKGERTATKVLENGKRIRVLRSSGEAI